MSKKKTAKKRTATVPVASSAPVAANKMPPAPALQSRTPAAMPARAAKPSGKSMSLAASSAEAIAQAQAGFGEEYRYVLKDLKRIGVIAAGMFTLLIALALIVR
jgi:hypothetical protein